MENHGLLAVSVLGLVLWIAPHAQADPVVMDQVAQGAIQSSFNNSDPSLTWQQEVVAGVSGTLVGIEVLPTTAGRSATFFVNVGPAWQTDANDFQTTYTSTVGLGWDYIDLSAAGITLSAGDTFVWGTIGTGGGLVLTGSSNPGLYTLGQLWLNGVAFVGGDQWDMHFRTYMDAGAPVPEPATLALVGIATVCAIARGRGRAPAR